MNDSNRLVNKIERAAIDTVEAASLAHRVGERFARGDAHRLRGIRERQPPRPAAPCSWNPRRSWRRSRAARRPGCSVEVELVHADLASRKVLFRIVGA